MKRSGLSFFLLSVIVLLALGIIPFYLGSYTLADSLRGYETLEQFKQGAHFNTLNYPSVENALATYSVSWWAPGQWLLPFVLQFVGISDYQSIQAFSILGLLLLSFLGYRSLFRALEIDPWTRSLSLLILVASPLFYWQSLMYHGGDILLLAYFPWFLYALLKIQQHQSFLFALSFLFLGIIGVYLKTSFLVLFAGGGLFLFFSGQHTLKDRVKGNYLYLIAALIVLGFTKIILLQGETPSSAVDSEGWFGVPNTFAGDLLHAIASPLGNFSNLSTLIQAKSASTGNTLLLIFGLLILAILSLWITIRVLLRNENYGKTLLFIGYSFFIVMNLMYLTFSMRQRLEL